MTVGNVVAASIAAGLVIAGASATIVTWWDSDVATFDQSARTAVERLQAARRAVDGTGLGGLNVEAMNTDRDAVRIRVMRAGDPVGATCRVTIRPAFADKSHVRTDCTQPNTADQAMRRLGSEALAIVVREHVAAAIENRDYDIDRVAGRMIGFAVMNRSAIAASMRAP